MVAMTGSLKPRTLYLVIKYDNGIDEAFYAPSGSKVTWDGIRSNEGHEDAYGGKRLLWCELPDFQSTLGLEYEDVEWENPGQGS